MAGAVRKPNVLIFGGLNTYTRAIAGYLVPVEGEPVVSHLRIVDKYSVAPPTTYLGSEFKKVLESPIVEYRQANLTVAAVISSAFDPPQGQEPYDYVFDLTGEIRHDRPEMIQINSTCNVARIIGLESAKRKTKAHVRLHLPFYETSGKGSHDEKEDVEPLGTIGTWWHEALRMVAAIEDLNLVILRIGAGYGPFVDYGDVTGLLCVTSVYGYLKKPMKSLHSPGKNPTHTVHSDDIAGGILAVAKWIEPLDRKAADAAAGEEIRFHNDKAKVKEVEGMPAHDAKVVAPLFNLVDDSESTLLSTGTTLATFFGTSFGFFNTVEAAMFKFSSSHTVEEINEQHVGGWTEMLQNSNPPITSTPLTAYMDKYALAKHVVAFSNAKIKQTVGYKLKRPQLDHETVREIVDKWKAEGSFPNTEA